METTPTARLSGVIEYNRGLLARARELNWRAGEQVFPAMDRTSLAIWLASRLQGARCGSEVSDPEALRLPELEQGIVDLVVGENPDEIILLAKSLMVEYRDGYAPRVTLDRETISAHAWQELPNAGVKLPGGRLVEVVVPFGYYDTVSGQNIPELKSRCVSRANKSLWDNWPSEGRPAIALPDPSDPTSVVPEIIECQYGISVIDGTSLVAFGAVALKGYRYYSSDPYFEGKWFQVCEEANVARAKSAAKLAEIRKESIEQKQIDEVRATAEAAKGELSEFSGRDGWWELGSSLRDEVNARTGYYSSTPSDLDGIKAWTSETRVLKAKVEQAFASIAERKVQEERERLATEETQRGHIRALLDHEGVQNDFDYAQRIDAFVKDAIAMRGAKGTARILAGERDRDYGRGRRANAIQSHFPWIDTRGLDWKAWADIVPVAFWAQKKASEGVQPQQAAKPAAPAAQSTKPMVPAQSGGFTIADLTNKFGGDSRRR